MDLQEFIIKNGYKEKTLKWLENYGNPEDELTYLYQMPVCYESKKFEFRIDHKYLLWSKKKGVFSMPDMTLIRTEKMKYCFFCRCLSGAFSEVGVLRNAGKQDGVVTLSSLLKASDGKQIFENIRRYVQGFETWESSHKEYRWDSSVNGIFYIVGPEGLFMERHEIFSDKIEMRKLVSSFEEICWCEQRMTCDGDSTDSYALVLYLIDGKKIEMSAKSAFQAYHMALTIKDNAPHLLYDPCEEYRMLYKKSPAQLMDIAKSKVVK